MSLTCLASRLICLSLLVSLSSSKYSWSSNFHQYCNATDPNVIKSCHLYLNESATFVCPCGNTDCEVSWKINNTFLNYTSNLYSIKSVDFSIQGKITCEIDNISRYDWDVTVSVPTMPTLVVTPQHQLGDCQNVYHPQILAPISDTCFLCFNVSVTGDPSPDITWKYRNSSMDYNQRIIIATNDSERASHWFVLDNGQKLCFNDIKNVHMYEAAHYEFTATNAAGNISVCFDAISGNEPFSNPGDLAIRGPVSISKGETARLRMDTYVQDITSSPSFKVCRYNASSSQSDHSICCDCLLSEKCPWGTLDSKFVGQYMTHFVCYVNTSHIGYYQFEVSTTDIPCYVPIGNTVEVQERNSFDLHIVLYVGGAAAAVSLVVLVVVFGLYIRNRFRRQRFRNVNIGGYHPVDQHEPVSEVKESDSLVPQTPLTNEPADSTTQPSSRCEYGTAGETNVAIEAPYSAADNLVHIGLTLSPAGVDSGHTLSAWLSGSGSHHVEPVNSEQLRLESNAEQPGRDLPMQDTEERSGAAMVPSSCRDLIRYNTRTVYVTFRDDSKKFVNDILKPIFTSLINIVKMVTINDAIPGLVDLQARNKFIKEASKICFVISQQAVIDKYSKESKLFMYDISRAHFKDPDQSKITVIPILYGNTTSSDLPDELNHLIPIKADDTEFIAKFTKSILS